MKRIREEIKKLSAEQRILKNQRKAVHIVGERIEAYHIAASRYKLNKHKLRLLYATQQILKGRDIPELEPTFKYKHLCWVSSSTYANSPLKNYCDQLMRLAEDYTDPIETPHASYYY